MNMLEEFYLAEAPSRLAKKWKNRKWRWRDFQMRCQSPTETAETPGEYAAMSPEEKSNAKDCGGFVGGYLADGIRKTANVKTRTLITLDLDYGCDPDELEDILKETGWECLAYTTHSHTPEKPRYRLIVLPSREMRPEEYEPAARRVAEQVGIEMLDHTAYETARLFYWPSKPKDGEFKCISVGGKPADVDALLGSYKDWRDSSEWPTSSRERTAVKRVLKKAEDPRSKKGVIGAFCRAYPIEDALATFLPDIYEPTATPGRYTYKEGTVAGGLVCYDGLFAYSHHESDPAHGLSNAFDLVRIHKFGHLDEGKRTEDATKLPSYAKMLDFASSDKGAKLETLKAAREDFAELCSPMGEEDAEWMAKMDVNRKTGQAENTINNLLLILENDPGLKRRLWHDQFSGFDIVEGGLPWRADAKMWTSADEANLRVYVEKKYGIATKDKLKDARVSVCTAHGRHPVKEYLEGLPKWDGIKRLDRIVCDYLGAEDDPLTRAVSAKQFIAAVKRLYEPGCKHDYCLIMAGPEGAGKSTLLAIMAGEWFNDSLTTTEGKEGMEQLQTSWIIELAELSSIKKSEAEAVKNYLSRRCDTYRAAYGTVVEQRPRHCVFFGTTNEDYFLKGDNGNRRFWIVRVNPDLRAVSDLKESLERDRDQLWAEALHRYRQGEQTYLSAEMEAEMRKRQAEVNDNADDPLEDMLRQFLDTPLPAEWASMDITQRQAWFKDPDLRVGIEQRDRVCIAEFLCERLCRSMADKEYKFLARRVAKMMGKVEGWALMPSNTRHAERLYGRQKGWMRVEENMDSEDDL